jgi:hypothetical protein
MHAMSWKLEPGAYYGTTERRYDLGGLTLTESVYPSGLVIPPHEHANAFFCLYLEGCCTQSCADRTSTARPLTLTIFPAGLVHAKRWHDSTGRVLHIELARRWLERLRGGRTVLDRPASYEGGPVHVPAGETAVVVMLGQADPALVLLALNVGLARLPLGVEGVELLVEALLG